MKIPYKEEGWVLVRADNTKIIQELINAHARQMAWMRMPSNAKHVHKCEHQQWSTCKADDAIGS